MMEMSKEEIEAKPKNFLGLLERVLEGEIVVPEFQRDFIWGKKEIEELLDSWLKNYFIGSFLMLEIPRDECPFGIRLIEGVERVNPKVKPARSIKVILDGQQRITSAFYALYCPDIPVKGAKHPYSFYVHIKRLLKGEEEAVFGVSKADKKRKKQVEDEIKQGEVIPITLLKDIIKLRKWEKDIAAPLLKEGRLSEEIIDELYTLAERFRKFSVPVVEIAPETPKGNIAEIFERINRTGTRLSIFDLAVSKLFRYGIKLRVFWREFASKYPDIAKNIKREDVLRVIALLRGKECRKSELLELEPDKFKDDWEKAISGIVKAYKRVIECYGVINYSKWMPFDSMIVPLSALLKEIESRGESAILYEKLDKWYWASVFTNRYERATDTTSYIDFREVKKWFDGDKEPDFIANFKVEGREDEFNVDDKKTGIYRGIINLIALRGALDFYTGQPIDRVDKATLNDEHIFPRRYREDSIFNRTLITKRSNQRKGDKEPSDFLNELVDEFGEQRTKEILATHFIDEEAYKAIMDNDLTSFISARMKCILKFIENKVKTY